MLKKEMVPRLLAAPLVFMLQLILLDSAYSESKPFFGGVSFGQSTLEPDDTGTSFILDDSSSIGYKVQLGYDWNKHFSTEIFYSDLGEAKFLENRSLSYKLYGLTSTYRHRLGKEIGLSAYITGGITGLSNSGNVPFRQENNLNTVIGLGLEYHLNEDYSVALGFDSYQEDAQLVHVSLTKRFGSYRLSGNTRRKTRLNKGWYGSVGFGLSTLEPDDSGTEFILEDDSSTGVLIQLGYLWNNRFSTEVFYTDLGEAIFQDDLSLTYSETGLSSTYRYPLFSHNALAYIKLGASRLSNSGDVPFRQDNSIQVMGGVGVERYIGNNFSISLGYELYQEDAQLLLLAIHKRFGQIIKPIEPWKTAQIVNDDPDSGNNVLLAYTTQNITHPDVLTTILGEIEDISFEYGTARLKPDSRVQLDRIATIINTYFTDLYFTIVVHTDDIGNSQSNLSLSHQQANVILEYFKTKGIDDAKYKILGKGEALKVAANNSPEGRERNRRIELFLQY